MTDMIASDLQDMHNHPLRTVLAALFTLLIMLGCASACLFAVWSAVIGVIR